MLAAIVRDGRFAGVHFTYITADGQKARILHPAGEVMSAKKVRGFKQGGAIELVRGEQPRRLIVGEGIETVLSVWQALARIGRVLSRTAFWSSVDLGNLGGAALESLPHPVLKSARGGPRIVPGPVPDLEAPAIAVPDSVEDLVLLGDGDSDRFLTECSLKRAARRYARGGRTVRIAWADEGRDFNDMLRGAG
jgi:hypothetical protein